MMHYNHLMKFSTKMVKLVNGLKNLIKRKSEMPNCDRCITVAFHERLVSPFSVCKYMHPEILSSIKCLVLRTLLT